MPDVIYNRKKIPFKAIKSENENNENIEDSEETFNIRISTVLLISHFKLLVCKKCYNAIIF